ncbi:hypothetical protein K505DRAFT_247870 [Melanomma pulvis-pyrius CBS 109.77]|uniref:PH domain-containing protein n=1 Tax=Melanomma pulvis-pyrius CBS 109.77 TaxID=1314802 RepID=A0A6A6X6M1_9PLEO|nr:hypothetical protein K505DRAFT_247870 [Melanomma pulvis-pyrius CBS 109.77]
MATTPRPGAYAMDDHNGSDPFLANPHEAQRQRYSAFDNSQFSLYLNGSPAQAKRALQAHLSETTRRLQETSHLGNALVQQRKELEEKMKEVETQQEDSDIGPELRQRLAELEKEFNEVGRETARAFLPKSRVPSGEADTTAGASVYSSEALHSPSKVSVPSRKQRNQQPSRINDIALATEISTSLLSQLKDLQSVLLEKDESLKAANLDRSQLEIEVEGLSQRLRTIDESESRLKDVNWNLETQVREFEALTKAAADKEQRMNHNLNLAKSEKSTLEREFEELKQLYAKLNEDHGSSTKHHETELSGLRRNFSMAETERGALQRKVDELASQNQELARAVAYRMRAEEQGFADDTSPDDGGEEGDTITPEHSPPPSPSKATPRHGQLESETLKHSLHHAHRMIQQLKNNIHREKTEKIELKRMLQDARDELESNRSSVNGAGSAKKARKNDKDIFKKPARPDRLGALRTGSQEVMMDDDDWEEHEALQNTPSKRSRQVDVVPGAFPSGFSSAAETSTNEGFETANDTSDAFETANEREGTQTETDAFQTGAETLDGDSSDLTETEGGPVTSTVRAQRPTSTGNRNAYESTASTSGDDSDDMDIKTPIQAQHPRYRLKLRQGGYRRSTPRLNEDMFESTPPAAKDSPASFASNSNNSTPAQGKSLFAELGSFSGESEDGSVADGTPSRSSLLSPDSSPEAFRKSTAVRSPLQLTAVPKPVMISSGMMTEPWLPTPATTQAELQSPTEKALPASHISVPTEPKTPIRLNISSISTQDTKPVSPVVLKAPPQLLRLSTLSTQGTVPRDAPPTALHISAVSAQATEPVAPVIEKVVPPSLNMSTIAHQTTEPREPVVPVVEKVIPPSLNMSSIAHQATEPREPIVEKVIPPSLNMSSIAHQTTEPREPVLPIVERAVPAVFNMSSITHQETEPREPSKVMPVEQEAKQAPLLVSSLSHQTTEPVAAPKSAPLQFSGLFSQATEPLESAKPAPSQISMLSSQATEPIEPLKPKLSQVSAVSSQATEPVEAPKPRASQFSSLSFQGIEPVASIKPTLSLSSMFSSQATEPVEPPRRVLSHVPAITVHNTEPAEPQFALQPENRFSDVMVLQDTQPESPTLPAFLPMPSRPSTAKRIPKVALAFSPILSQETEPYTPSRPVTAQRSAPFLLSTSGASAQTEDNKMETPGYFGSGPWGKSGSEDVSAVSKDGRTPLGSISANAMQTERSLNSRSASPVKAPQTSMADEGTQTMVSADQIDKLLAARTHRHSGTIATAGVDRRMSPPASPRRNSNDPMRSPRRPGSSGSIRSRAASPPPLPPDHKQVIAAAALKTPPLPGVQPITPGAMGPPAMPASAYKKRPQTPTIKTNVAVSSPKTGGTTPRARYQSQRGENGRSGASSPISRRTSVSSFGSEIEHRFNGGMPFGQSGFDPNTTDPRMIQAITQTMIGEFLWKYTRKAGRGDMSENRHRRFFWVHPYTRTLYWSEQDPATAGRAQLKAKSVAIDAVQEVSDDNAYPPGLHRKSLVVITPGRTIKFTATTSQRHETWFNSLSYLLRPEGEQEEEKEAADEIQTEFNAGGFRSTSRQTTRSRMGSYMSGRSSPHAAQIPTLRQSTVTQHRASSTEPSKQGSMSRLSSFIRPTSALRGSFSSRRSQTNSSVAGTPTSEFPEVHSNEDLMRALEEKRQRDQRDQERLEMENVRACCDGKHDVGHLHMHSLKDRHKSYNSGVSLAGSMGSRSQSRNSGRNSQAGGR